jgi:hypothetical protein
MGTKPRDSNSYFSSVDFADIERRIVEGLGIPVYIFDEMGPVPQGITSWLPLEMKQRADGVWEVDWDNSPEAVVDHTTDVEYEHIPYWNRRRK